VTSLPAPALRGDVVRLDPLREDDAAELFPLLADPGVYTAGYLMHGPPASASDTRRLLRERFLDGQGEADGRGNGRTAYAVRLLDGGALVGTTSFLEADLGNESIHIGSTFYGRRWWGTAVNPACKYLLLRHAFEERGYGRVKIQTDALNLRSRAAIAKLGAVEEGTLRRHSRREDGSFRDTVVFSVLAAEWPDVATRLRARLSGDRPGHGS
jgi:RimJ/RimL family protein N-acetyltransferase